MAHERNLIQSCVWILAWVTLLGRSLEAQATQAVVPNFPIRLPGYSYEARSQQCEGLLLYRLQFENGLLASLSPMLTTITCHADQARQSLIWHVEDVLTLWKATESGRYQLIGALQFSLNADRHDTAYEAYYGEEPDLPLVFIHIVGSPSMPNPEARVWLGKLAESDAGGAADVTSGSLQRPERRRLEGALDFFCEDVGRYPKDEEALRVLIKDAGIPNWNGPYLTVRDYSLVDKVRYLQVDENSYSLQDEQGRVVVRRPSEAKRDTATLPVAPPHEPSDRGIVRAALDLFRFDMGRFPTADESLDALIKDPGLPGWSGPYVSVDQAQVLSKFRYTPINADKYVLELLIDK